MSGIFILNLVIVFIELLDTTQHYISIIPELLVGMHQYQKQCINFYENYGYHHIEYYGGLL